MGSIDAWACLRFVLGLSPVGDFVWSRLRIWVFFFFFFLCYGLVVVVVVVVVIYYFIIVEILFYCDEYIILLC